MSYRFKRINSILLVISILIQVFSMFTFVRAEETVTETVDIVDENTVIDENYGVINNLYGKVNYNYGTILNMYGSIQINYGCVNNNYGVIQQNYKSDAQSGTVIHNFGVIQDNYASVTFNEKEGHIEGNIQQGIVSNNYGSIASNVGGGFVDVNNGTISANHSTLSINNGIVVSNEYDGRITTNNGNVYENYSGHIEDNEGVVDSNIYNAVIEYNNGTVKQNGYDSSIDNNEGCVEYNKYNGVIGLNDGRVERNAGTININGSDGFARNIGTILSSQEGSVVEEYYTIYKTSYNDLTDIDHDLLIEAEFGGENEPWWIKAESGEIILTVLRDGISVGTENGVIEPLGNNRYRLTGVTESTSVYLFSKQETISITFTDGVEDEYIFQDNVVQYKSGDTITAISGFERPGYVFVGWEPELDTIATHDTVYTAVWRRAANRIRVTYSDGVDGTIFEDVIYEGLEGAAVPVFNDSELLKREGFVFGLWSPREKLYAPLSEDTVFTAVWLPDSNENGIADEYEVNYEVTYTDGVGGEAFTDQMYAVSRYSAAPAFNGQPHRSGYVFECWEIEGTRVDSPESITVDKNIVFVAVWERDLNNNGTADYQEIYYTVKYTDGVEDVVYFEDEQYRVIYGSDIPSYAGNAYNARPGYAFVGFELIDGEYELNYVTKNLTYVAIWEIDENNNQTPDIYEDHYTVTYTDGSGEEKFFENQTTQVLWGAKYPEFNGTPTRDGYIFYGWSPDINSYDIVYSDKTIVAVWLIDINNNNIPDIDEQLCSVRYTDGVEDSVIFEDVIFDNIRIGEKTPVYEPTAGIRNRFVFVGWSPSVKMTVNSDIVYSAMWKEDANENGVADDREDTYTVTFTDGFSAT